MNFETGPPPVWLLLISGALPSGAVSSSWMWKRLTSVFTVISSLTAFHAGFTLLLAGYLRLVSVPSLFAFCFLIRRMRRVGCDIHPDRARPAVASTNRVSFRLMAVSTGTKDVVATSPKEAIAYCEENDVRFVRLWFTDLLGQLKSFSIHAAELDDAFEGGMGFDGSSITGFNPIEESDMIALPDPSTIKLIPWRPEGGNRTARMFCDIR